MLVLVLALAGAGSGADVWARKMEIVKVPGGHVTVLRDSVVITDEGSRLVSRQATMSEARGVAVARESVVITSPEATVRADSAVYSLRDRTAELFGRVTVTQESVDITAPRLFYSVAEKSVRADHGVVLESRERDYRLTGRRGVYELDSAVGVVDSEPVLTWIRSSDSMRVTGRKMGWYERPALATADGEVRVASGDGELTCDSALFYADADSGIAWGGPRVRDRSGTASGDTMLFNVRDGALDRVAVRGGAAGTYSTEGGDVVNVKGSSIRLWLERGDIGRIEVEGMTASELRRGAGAVR